MRLLIGTNTGLLSMGLLFLRWMTGIIFFVAGAGKVFGWFGGMGMKATIDIFASQMHLSAFWTYLSSYTELIGGFLLIVGLLTRPAAFALVINMIVAMAFVGFKNFFMGGGAYPFSLMISCFVILLTGPMAYSFDAWLGEKRTN